MNRKICLFLIFVLVFQFFCLCSYAENSNSKRELDLVSGLGIMNGYPDGSFGLEKNVSRAEFTKIAISASKYRNLVATNLTVSPFHDVKFSHWAAPYIKIASQNKLVTGYSDSTFKPDNNVTYEEAVTICLRLLGYTSDDFGSSWPYGQIGISENIGLSDNMSSYIGMPLTRGDVVTLIFNLLNTKSKDSQSYFIESLDYKIVEDAILIASSNEDTSVGSDKIYTSSGTYKITENFNFEDVGKKGDLVIRDNDTLVMFVPSEQKIEEYSIYQVLNNTLVAYSGGLTKNVDVDKNITVYNKTSKTTLSSLMGNIATGDILTVYKTSSGALDYALLKTENMTGPITVNSTKWYEMTDFNAKNATVMRNGTKTTLDSIELFDIVYYSKELNTVWAYSKKVTGIYESASPNKDSLTQVTVSGVTYEIESAKAFNALSSTGSYNFGDTITLLIGRNGKVADVKNEENAQKDVLYGFLAASGTKEFTNADGDTYTSFYADVILPSGEKYQYASKRIYDSLINSVVKVTFTDGVAAISSYSTSNNQLGGKVDAASFLIGNYKLSEDVEILDVLSTDHNAPVVYKKVFLQRLDGIELSSSKVIYAEKNSSGKYNKIILKDVTGDLYDYGVVIKAESEKSSGRISGRYTYDIGGKQSSFSTNNKAYSIYTGQAAQFVFGGSQPYSVTSLKKIDAVISNISENKVITKSGKEYKLSDDAVIYFKNNEYKYTVLPISEISENTNYRLSCYYDKEEKFGGRIRVVVCENK